MYATSYVICKLCTNTLFDVIGVHITRLEKEDNHFVNAYSEATLSELADDGGVMVHISARNNESLIRRCCALSFYSICFLIKSCTNWNSQTLDAIIDHGNEFYQKQFACPDEHCLSKFPSKLRICDGTVDIVFTVQKEGLFSCASSRSKRLLQNFILDNISGNTGFTIWFSNLYWQKLAIKASDVSATSWRHCQGKLN